MVKTDNVATSDFLTQKKLTRASKTNLPSLIDMVLEYKLGRTNQVADALSRKTELAAFKCEAVAATSRVTSTLPHRIRDGLEKGPARSLLHQAKECKTRLGSRMGSWSQKGIHFFFFQNLSFFGMPLREQGVPRTSGAKTKQGKSFDCVLNIDPCLSCSTS